MQSITRLLAGHQIKCACGQEYEESPSDSDGLKDFAVLALILYRKVGMDAADPENRPAKPGENGTTNQPTDVPPIVNAW